MVRPCRRTTDSPVPWGVTKLLNSCLLNHFVKPQRQFRIGLCGLCNRVIFLDIDAFCIFYSRYHFLCGPLLELLLQLIAISSCIWGR